MADFATSTHRERWILSRDTVLARCRAANHRAVDALHKYGATRVEVQPDGSLAYPGTASEVETGMKGSLPEPLSVEEEFVIRRFYEQKIQQVCAAFSFPNKIQATAIMYFKRFYLDWSVMEHDPKHIMLTCIYISCKVEEFHVSAEELGKGIKQDPQVVLKNEMTVLQGLSFDLIVYAPYRALEGYIFDLDNLTQGKGPLALQKVQELKEAAQFVADSMMLTEAPLLFPPGQLALAALRAANQKDTKVDFERYLKGLTDRFRSKHAYSELAAALDSIDAIVKDGKHSVEADVRPIDRRLKICRNPDLQDENKKRERKGKHKQKRPQQDAPPSVDTPSMDMSMMQVAKRRHSGTDAML